MAELLQDLPQSPGHLISTEVDQLKKLLGVVGLTQLAENHIRGVRTEESGSGDVEGGETKGELRARDQKSHKTAIHSVFWQIASKLPPNSHNASQQAEVAGNSYSRCRMQEKPGASVRRGWGKSCLC